MIETYYYITSKLFRKTLSLRYFHLNGIFLFLLSAKKHFLRKNYSLMWENLFYCLEQLRLTIFPKKVKTELPTP